jgi:hypothetical protein
MVGELLVHPLSNRLTAPAGRLVPDETKLLYHGVRPHRIVLLQHGHAASIDPSGRLDYEPQDRAAIDHFPSAKWHPLDVQAPRAHLLIHPVRFVHGIGSRRPQRIATSLSPG